MAFDRCDAWGSELRSLRRSVMLPVRATGLTFTMSVDTGANAFITKALHLVRCSRARGLAWVHAEAREDVTSAASADEFLTLPVTTSAEKMNALHQLTPDRNMRCTRRLTLGCCTLRELLSRRRSMQRKEWHFEGMPRHE
ncbi:MAG TPA: hypothetical protein VJU59_13520 [Paraburkholderia sp.]|uniref:hypothetical protein n=1 Tax=Paraburkholderia sp. TaxID=1926495 RepID=UPI002B49B076|nr:hypothetical protein [Paraburkholderia sp.]HKR40675.1 hypothetical protein [Paraburkholderia sp.]